jgi:hypothetical protein
MDTAKDILVAAKVTNTIFPRNGVGAHSPCDKGFAGAQNGGKADPIESEIVTNYVRRFGTVHSSGSGATL